MKITQRLLDFKVTQAEANKRASRPGTVGASSVGYAVICPRQLYWRQRETSNDTTSDGRIIRLLEHGESEEQRLLSDLRAAGIEVIGNQFSAQSPDGKIRCRVDGIVNYDGSPAVLEIKTMNDRNFKSLKNEGPPEMHFAQMQTYMGLLGIPRCVYVVINKNTDELYEELVPYDESYFLRLTEAVNSVLSNEDEPEKSFERRSDPCRFCPAAQRCWQKEIIVPSFWGKAEQPHENEPNQDQPSNLAD